MLGHGGVKRVSEATGVARGSIMAGLKELKDPENRLPQGRVRRSGGGRKRLVDRDPDLLVALEGLVDPAARGDPQSPLRWTCKSLKQLARELGEQGHRISHVSVGILLKELGYSLQGNRKTVVATVRDLHTYGGASTELNLIPDPERSRTLGTLTGTGPRAVMISRSGRCPLRTTA